MATTNDAPDEKPDIAQASAFDQIVLEFLVSFEEELHRLRMANSIPGTGKSPRELVEKAKASFDPSLKWILTVAVNADR